MLPNNLNPKRLAIQTFRDGEMSEILVHQGEMESETISRANTLLEMAGISERITPVEPSVRSDELVDAILAVIDGDIPKFYASKWAEANGANKAGMDTIGLFADIDEDTFEERRDRIVSRYRDGPSEFGEMSDEELFAHHIDFVYGADVDTFKAEVVEWPDGREAETLERVFSGDSHDTKPRVFTGLRTAHTAMDEAMDEINEIL